MGMLGDSFRHRGGGESKTKQSDALQTDVNAIMKRYVAHGVLPPASTKRARYGDFTSASSFHEAMDRVLQAEQDFNRLPAQVRDACQNQVAIFVEACSTEEGRAELRELGLDPAWLPADQVVEEPAVPVAAKAAPEPAKPAKGSKPDQKGDPAS